MVAPVESIDQKYSSECKKCISIYFVLLQWKKERVKVGVVRGKYEYISMHRTTHIMYINTYIKMCWTIVNGKLIGA